MPDEYGDIEDTYGNEGIHEEEIEKTCVYCGWNFTGSVCPCCRHGIDGVYYRGGIL